MWRLFLILLLLASSGEASTWYVTQNGQGSFNGTVGNAWTNTGGAHPPVWGGAGVLPGDTIHLNGTFTSAFTIATSGTAGSPVTILADSNCVFVATSWATTGAINAYVRSYLTIDGQHQGLIFSTANGDASALPIGTYSPLSYSAKAIFINPNGSGSSTPNTNVIVRNWLIGPLYVMIANGTNASTAYATGIYVNDVSNLTVSGNLIHDAATGIYVASDHATSVSNMAVSTNTIWSCSAGVNIASGNYGDALSSVTLNNNSVAMGANWFTGATDTYHIDGFHLFTQVLTIDQITGVAIYDNFMFGPTSTDSTAFIYLEDEEINPLVYNNIFLASGSVPANGFIDIKRVTPSAWASGSNYNFNSAVSYSGSYYYCTNSSGLVNDTVAPPSDPTNWASYTPASNTQGVYNNTMVSTAGGNGIYFQSTAYDSAKAENNLEDGLTTALYVSSTFTPASTLLSNYNCYYNCTHIAYNQVNSTTYTTLANWNTANNTTDVNSIVPGSLTLSGIYGPLAGSALLGAGANLSASFTTDFYGYPLPSSGPWTIGAISTAPAGTANVATLQVP